MKIYIHLKFPQQIAFVIIIGKSNRSMPKGKFEKTHSFGRHQTEK
jgi:hypothetical protein